MTAFNKHEDFTLITHEDISRYSKSIRRSVSLSELAAYAETRRLECKQSPLPWHPDGCGEDLTCYSKNGKHALRHWVSLMDMYGRNFSDDWAFLTVETFTRDDAGVLIRTNLRHYMPLDWAASEVKHAREQGITELHSIVQEQVERGVRYGVALAIEESTANLKEVQTEKQRIDEQIAALQAERERIETIEQRLEAREAQRLAVEAEKAARKQNKSRAGYVYLVQSLTSISYYKIGRTANPDKRMKRFEVKLPFEIQPICLIATDDMKALEKKLHARYATQRVDGEFFALSTNDVSDIKALADNLDAVRKLLDED